MSDLITCHRLQQIYDEVGVLIFGGGTCLHWVDKWVSRPSRRAYTMRQRGHFSTHVLAIFV